MFSVTVDIARFHFDRPIGLVLRLRYLNILRCNRSVVRVCESIDSNNDRFFILVYLPTITKREHLVSTVRHYNL